MWKIKKKDKILKAMMNKTYLSYEMGEMMLGILGSYDLVIKFYEVSAKYHVSIFELLRIFITLKKAANVKTA